MRQQIRKTHEADTWFNGARVDLVSLKNSAHIKVTFFESCSVYYSSATCNHNSEKPLGGCGSLLCKLIFKNGWVWIHIQSRHSYATAMVVVGSVAYCPNLAKNYPSFLRRNLRISSTNKMSSARIVLKLVPSSYFISISN